MSIDASETFSRTNRVGSTIRPCWFVALFLFAGAVAAVDFEKDIEPIFAGNCADCHGPEKQKGKFRVDRLANLLRGGDSGEAAIVRGKPDESFLLKLIRHEESNLEMPPKGSPLSPDEIKLIETWIAEGAATPDSYGPETEKQKLTHWSFQPVQRPKTGDEIDDFVRSKLESNGLKFSAGAERRVLIRRLYLVMLGFQPSPEQVEAFINDKSTDAWVRLVEEVLASPHYGERIASMWLDLARFGESHGFEMNRERTTAWPYRDWVIEAFNEDKPYDEFVREQIAGDALGDPVGTGFLVAGPVDQVKGSDPKLRVMQRMNELDDIINTTGTAFLGLTTGCARCHNHKFDPISQSDYYSMQAVFAGVAHGDAELPLDDESAQRISALGKKVTLLTKNLETFIPKAGSGKLRPALNSKRNVELFSERPAKFVRFTIEETSGGQACIDELEIFSNGKNISLASAGAIASSGGDFKHPLHKLAHINDGKYGNARSWIASQKKGGWVQIEFPNVASIQRIEWGRDREGKYSDRLTTQYRIETATVNGKWELLASSKNRAPFNSKKKGEAVYDFAGHSADKVKEGKNWVEELKKAKAEQAAIKKSALVYAGKFSQPGPTHRLYRGEPDAKREIVGPGAITSLTTLDLAGDAAERERRLAFANWLADEGNPLTARVIANRVWQFHFGTGLVDTPSDFGRNGTAPTHPELLDFLAVELMENNWSIKYLHRLILQSQTWMQDSRPDAEAMRVDAASRLLWRFPPRRLEAEAIRDSMLTTSGEIRLDTMGGPGFSAFEVEMENVRHYYPKKSYGPEDWRRMIYMTKIRQEKDVVFGAFDCPDASQAVAKRSRSTTPLQALNLLNSIFVSQQAKLFAERITKESPDRALQIDRAWRLCFNRAPMAEELRDASEFIESHGLVQFTRAMLNANEFVFIP